MDRSLDRNGWRRTAFHVDCLASSWPPYASIHTPVDVHRFLVDLLLLLLLSLFSFICTELDNSKALPTWRFRSNFILLSSKPSGVVDLLEGFARQ